MGIEAGEEALEVGTGEGPLERPGVLPVVVAEAQQPFGERVEGVRSRSVSTLLRWTIEK